MSGHFLRQSFGASFGACLLVGILSSASLVAEGQVYADWGPAVLLESDDRAESRLPQVASDEGGNVTAAWQFCSPSWCEVWANRYEPGVGWLGASRMSAGGRGETFPAVAALGSGTAMVAWVSWDGSVDSIWVSKFTPSSGWGPASQIGNPVTTVDRDLRIAGNARGDAWALWTEIAGGSTGYLLGARYSAAGGWGPAVRVDEVSYQTSAPEVAVDGGGNATAVWVAQSSQPNPKVWARHFENGTGWGSAVQLSHVNNPADEPAVAPDGAGGAIATWTWANQIGGSHNIWSSRYTPASGWGSPVLVQADSSFESFSSSIAMDDLGNAVAVWEQYPTSPAYTVVWGNRYSPVTGWGTASIIEINNLARGKAAHVALNGDGNGFAVWQGWDGIRWNINANQYRSSGGWAGTKLIEGNNSGDATSPVVAADGLGAGTAVYIQSNGTANSAAAVRFEPPDILPPALSISCPARAINVSVPTTCLEGQTEVGATLTAGGFVVAVRSDGTFAVTLALREGQNTIEVVATDPAGNPTTVTVLVNFVDPMPAVWSQLAGLRADLSSAQAGLNATRATVTALSARLNATEAAMANLSSDAEDTQVRLNLTAGDLARAWADMNETSSRADALRADLGNLSAHVESVEASLAEIAGRSPDWPPSFDNISAEVRAVNASVQSAADAYGRLNESVAGFGPRISQLEASLKAAEAKSQADADAEEGATLQAQGAREGADAALLVLVVALAAAQLFLYVRLRQRLRTFEDDREEGPRR